MRIVPMVAVMIVSGCDSLFVEAAAPEVCQHLGAQRFTIPADVRAQYAKLPPEMRQEFELTRTFDFNVKIQLPAELQRAETTLKLTSVTVTAVAPTTDFGFLKSATLAIVPSAASGLSPHSFSYERQAPAPTVVTWLGDDFDVSPYLRAGNLTYTLSLVGALPDTDVTADIDACASASVRLNYLP